MSIMELGALGEFVGAIAVVVTLVYLAVQVRHNAEMTRAVVRQGVAEASLVIITAGMESDTFSNIMYRGIMEEESLEGEERWRFTRWLLANFRYYELAFKHYQGGIYPPDEWENLGNNAMVIFQHNPALTKAFWARVKENHTFDTQFVAEIDRRLNELEAGS